MNSEDSNMAANAICFAADQAKAAWQEAAWEQQRPSVVFKPALSKDGNMWCALFGDNLQEGVAGFGETPAKAMYAFDQAWTNEQAALPKASPGDGEREAIVAWLRERAASCRQAASDIGDDDDEALTAWVTRAETYDFIADAIERGDHLASAAGER